MDQRCLYGHRVPKTLKFAVQQRICPTCGAPTVTVLGYRLARRLAKEIPLDPINAFNAMYLLEEEHEIRAAEKEESDEIQAEQGEVTLSEEESGRKNGAKGTGKEEDLIAIGDT